MTRKLNTLFAATAVLTGITVATAAFAALGASMPQPPRSQGAMAQMSPDQMAQMKEGRSTALAAPDEEHRYFHVTHPAGTESR